MPFASKAQRGFLFAKHPEVAAKFARESPETARSTKLPQHVSTTPEKTALKSLQRAARSRR